MTAVWTFCMVHVPPSVSAVSRREPYPIPKEQRGREAAECRNRVISTLNDETRRCDFADASRPDGATERATRGRSGLWFELAAAHRSFRAGIGAVRRLVMSATRSSSGSPAAGSCACMRICSAPRCCNASGNSRSSASPDGRPTAISGSAMHSRRRPRLPSARLFGLDSDELWQ